MQIIIAYASENNITNCGEQKTKGHELARIASIRKDTHKEFADAIGEACDGDDGADHGMIVMQSVFNIGADGRQVCSNKIKQAVADESRFEHAPAVTRI